MTQAAGFERATMVFEGRVEEIAPEAGPSTAVRVALKVVRGWKGVESERVIVTTAGDSAGCGFGFVKGESYLVYATEREGVLSVSLCGRTRSMADADGDIAALGLGVTPVDVRNPDDPAAKKQPPARGGCAGCRVGHAPTGSTGWLLAALALGVVVRRRSRRLRR